MAHGTNTVVRLDQGADSAQSAISVLLVDDDTELCELLIEFFVRGTFGWKQLVMAGVDWPEPWLEDTTCYCST